MRFDGSLKKNLQKDPNRNIKAFVEHGTRTTCQRETIDSEETRDFHLDNFLNGILQNYFALSEMTLRRLLQAHGSNTDMTNVRDMTIV